MSRRNSLKAAFIVTTAITGATLAGGCFVSTTNPPPPCEAENNCVEQCPTALPAEGDACGEIGQVCSYGDPAPCADEPAHDATCGADGTWSVEFTGSTCNPPPPPPCPEVLPTAGTECEVNEEGEPAQGCSYTVKTSCGEATVQPQCVANEDNILVWQVEIESCNGDPGACATNEHPDLCAADTSCRWLVPGCGEPGQSAEFEAGCFAAEDCNDSSCGEGSACSGIVYDPCFNSSCDACGAEAQVCLPDDSTTPSP